MQRTPSFLLIIVLVVLATAGVICMGIPRMLVALFWAVCTAFAAFFGALLASTPAQPATPQTIASPPAIVQQVVPAAPTTTTTPTTDLNLLIVLNKLADNDKAERVALNKVVQNTDDEKAILGQMKTSLDNLTTAIREQRTPAKQTSTDDCSGSECEGVAPISYPPSHRNPN